MNLAEFGIIMWEILNGIVIPSKSDAESVLESLQRICDLVEDYDRDSSLRDSKITVEWGDR